MNKRARLVKARPQYLHGAGQVPRVVHVLPNKGLGDFSDFPITPFVVIGLAAILFMLANRS